MNSECDELVLSKVRVRLPTDVPAISKRHQSDGRPLVLRPPGAARPLAAADVSHLLAAGTEERHHRPQAAADLFDLMIGALLAQGVEVGSTTLALGHPLAGELARLDLLQDLLHL